MTVHLTRAPIIEALIDIRCEWGAGLAADVAIKQLEGLVSSVASEFPKVEPRQQLEIKTLPTQPAMLIRNDGFLLRSEKLPTVVQFGRGGFTFSRLAPYENWDDLRGSALRLWGQYCAAVGASIVKRVAVRYINRIQVPFPFNGSDEFLRGIRRPLTQPTDYSQVVSFMDQTVSVDSISGATVGFIRASQPRAQGAPMVDVVVDIDVFRETTDLSSADTNVWTIIDGFREVKNRVFFDAIGSSTIEKYR